MPETQEKGERKSHQKCPKGLEPQKTDLTGSITFCSSTSRPLEPFEVKVYWLHYLYQFMFQATKGIPLRYTQNILECPLNLLDKSTTTHLTQLYLMQQITYHNKTKKPKSLLFIITSKKEEPSGIEICPTMLGQHLL